MVRTAGRWPHLLLVVGVLTIALSVLAMHQLAVDHTLAALGNPGWHQADHAAVAGGEPHAPPAGLEQSVLAVVADGDSCSLGCSPDHDVSVFACLLALTLLVLRWRLVPPRQQPLPKAFLPRAPAVPVLRWDRRASLSLAELSIRRT